jgi:hypothetical protein
MITYNDLVNKLAEITYLADLFLRNSSRHREELLYYKIGEIHILLQNIWEKEKEEENERQEQSN